MAYGLSFEDVSHINRPASTPLPWGSVTACTAQTRYSLHRFSLLPGIPQPLHFHPDAEGHVFVEDGEAVVRSLDADGNPEAAFLPRGRVLPLPRGKVHAFASPAGAALYFVGPHVPGTLRFNAVETAESAGRAMASLNRANLPVAGHATTDRREKYWGLIETIVDGETAGKRIFVRAGGQSSLEFHVEKRETYWVHSGRLKVGLRVGRAENRSIVLGPGDGYDIRPGVMHMRIALEDTVIIEASTRDTDADSFLVEDGQTYRHVETQTSH